MAWGGDMTLNGLRDMVTSIDQIEIGRNLDVSTYAGVIEHDVNDQVVVVRAGTNLRDLNASMESVGQTIPYLSPTPSGLLGACVARNRPHLLQAQHGSWRDWVIGMTIIRGDGTIAKCGSKAVKNVAGYDAQKIMIGSAGRYALIAELILRTTPTKAVRPADLIEGPRFSNNVSSDVQIQRVLRTDFDTAVSANQASLIVADRAYQSLWLTVDSPTVRFESDWLFGTDSIAAHPIVDTRMKQILDPAGKFRD